jgi:hypothetical protein
MFDSHRKGWSSRSCDGTDDVLGIDTVGVGSIVAVANAEGGACPEGKFFGPSAGLPSIFQLGLPTPQLLSSLSRDEDEKLEKDGDTSVPAPLSTSPISKSLSCVVDV